MWLNSYHVLYMDNDNWDCKRKMKATPVLISKWIYSACAYNDFFLPFLQFLANEFLGKSACQEKKILVKCCRILMANEMRV